MNDLGRYGIWASGFQWPPTPEEIASAAAEVESLGFGAIWLGGKLDPRDDELALPAAILAATSRIVVGTSIINVWQSDPTALAASHARLRARFPGRFYLGLGSGHASLVEPATGQKWERPVSKLREYLAALPSVPVEERLIAALGPKALQTARELTAGALPYLVPPAHSIDARAILGPDKLLIPAQKVFLGADETLARQVGRRGLAYYLSLPNYLNNLRRYGLTDDDFAGEGSDRWVDTLLTWGDAHVVKQGVDAHLAAGANHVAVEAFSASPEVALPRAEWRAVADALFGN